LSMARGQVQILMAICDERERERMRADLRSETVQISGKHDKELSQY
jgi:hypothetical protein